MWAIRFKRPEPILARAERQDCEDSDGKDTRAPTAQRQNQDRRKQIELPFK
jgi:hypothetical protein